MQLYPRAEAKAATQARATALRDAPVKANEPLRPIVGICVFCLPMTEAQYIQLADCTGRQIRPNNRGAIAASQPPALRRLGRDPAHWTGQVKSIGSAYWLIVGSVEAKAIDQDWMKGIGYERWLAKAR